MDDESVFAACGTVGFFSAADDDPGCAAITDVSGLTGAPSKARAGAASDAAPKINAAMTRSDVRIAMFLVRTTRMGYGPSHCRPNLLGVFPESARCVIRLTRAPSGFAFGKLFLSQFYVKSPGDRVDLDDVAVLQ